MPASALGIMLLATGGSAATSPAQVRLGAAPARPSGSSVVGALAPGTRIEATVVLKPRDPAGLAAYATAVSTPGSNSYRHFLSVAEFRARFGPTDAQIAAVRASLQAHGLDPGPVSANGLAIPLTATADAIERAFSTPLQRLTLASGRVAFANARAPLLDATVAPFVQNVLGLDNLAVARPLAVRLAHPAPAAHPHLAARVATGGPQPCPTAALAAASVSPPVYTADQIASAYGFSGLYGAGDQGAGQTVAVYELEGNFPSDITAYQSCYGISAPVSYVPVDGGAPPANAAAGDGIETALDVEQIVGLAPKVNVLVYQGPNSNSNLPGSGIYDTYNAIISQNRAKILSTSWGVCEPQATPIPTVQQDENTLFEEAAVQGISVFAAAGDTGSSDCTNQYGDPLPGLAVDDPASQPFVTGAGGTRLPGVTPPLNESVWNDPSSALVCADALMIPSPCGGGGGVSSLWRMPTYQSGASPALHVINGQSSNAPCGAPAGSYCREVPDVSGDADPLTGYTIYWNGNGNPTDSSAWLAGIGGTSAVGPLWAALIAEANAFGACHGVPIGFANPLLYGTADNVYAGRFNDVTTGTNDVTGANHGLYPAGPGYDMASGLGTPNAAAIVQNLCAPAITVSNPGPQTSLVGSTVAVQITASSSSGATLSFAATGLPPGLSIDQVTGRIAGTTTVAGTYTVTVRATTPQGGFGSSTFAWRVSGPPGASGGYLSGIAAGAPRLTFTVAAGTAAPALRQLAIQLPRGLAFVRGHLRRGVVVVGANGRRIGAVSLTLSGGHLVLTLAAAKALVRVTIAPPALRASRALIAAVRRHRGGRVTITLTATDANGRATPLTIVLKPH